MAKVYNWQLGREMDFPYEAQRPDQQFAMIFDTNKCIACQTCTVACKTTWTPGRGQEYMYWNNVETKPYGFYPARLGRQRPGQARGPADGRPRLPGARRSSTRPRRAR